MPRWRILVLAATLVLAWPALLAAQKPPPDHAGTPSAPQSSTSSSPGKGKAKQRASWVPSADTICRDGLWGRNAVVEHIRRDPPPSVRAALLQILAGTVRVERTMIVRLERLHVRGGAARALALFRRRTAADAALVARLRRRWNADLLERQVRRDRATNARLADLWSSLGSNDCASYFRVLNGA